jgi:hypothetical protein
MPSYYKSMEALHLYIIILNKTLRRVCTMPRKPKVQQVEEEVDVIKPQKKETFISRWFKDYAVNNTTELKRVCELTARSAEEQFNIHLATGNTELFAAIFHATFLTILSFLKKQQKNYNEFSIEICNSINIGYVNNDDADNEKVGNFMPVMEHIGINRNIVNNDDSTDADSTNDGLMRWKNLNTKKNVECYKEIQEDAFKLLYQEYKTDIRTSETVIPLFCIFMDNIVSVLKVMYMEAKDTDVSEVSMNVLGLFDVFYSFDDEKDQEIIDFQPNITMKLALKNDETANRDI